jgi:hypothetical protein
MRNLHKLVLLTALALPIPIGTAADDDACPADGSAPESATAGADTVEPTRPGPWREDRKRDVPRERVPGTRMAAPADPLATEPATLGRWLRGYRPATEAARAAFEAWKAGAAATLGTADPSAMPSASSPYATNLLDGGRAPVPEDEAIERTVREERYAVSSIDLRRVPASADDAGGEGEKREKPESDTGIDHLSAMTRDEYLWVKRQAELAPETLDGQVASEAARAPGSAGVAFDAVPSNITSTPPDPILAVGPMHLVAIVNARYRVWNKSGVPVMDALTLDQFFLGLPHCAGVFDVYVDYDEALDRFVMGGMSLEDTTGTDSYLCLAATATNDPVGVWNRISFRADAVDTSTWIDYPHMGIGLDAIYIAGNMFLDGGNLDHVRAFAIDKDALYQGQPVAVAEANLGSLFFTVQPAKLHGFTSGGWPAPGTPHHFIAHDGGGNSRIWRWSDPLDGDPVVYGTIVEESFLGVPPSAPELGSPPGAGHNDTGNGRWLDAEYRGGKLWATRNVGCNFGGGTAESCIDWIQVDVSGPSPVLEQQQAGGAFGSTDDFRYYPDLSVDRNGSLAIGYTKSSATSYTQVWVTGREIGDPPGTLQSETLQRAGLGSYTDGGGCFGSCDRWGDYTGMTIDPDGCTFWYLGQYSDGGYFNWGTHIASFRYDSCSTDSAIQVDKGTYTCDDTITVTVTDSVAISASAAAAATTVSSSGGDLETIPAGAWTGSDCAAGLCESWSATLVVSGAAVSSGDGTVDVGDGETITVAYDDPHAGHADRSRNLAVTCRTRLEEAGYLTQGGCEGGQGTELYRDYMDGGELVSYTFGIFNPATAPALTDIEAELVVSGPAASKVTVFDPVVYIGALAPGQLTAPVFTLAIDPSIDTAGLRMSSNDFRLRITSVADGFTETQLLTQSHLLQTDDHIVTETECFDFESGTDGFVEASIQYQYTCQAAACGTQTNVNTVAAPWSRGPGCGSETRTDDPRIPCDTGGTNAFKSNPNGAACGTFAQSNNTLVDTVLYSPIFGPAHTGLAPNGQPWLYDWRYATWYFRSDMVSFIDPAMAVAFYWDRNYPGTATPATNEIYDYYPYFYGNFFYPNLAWDSATPWSAADPPANVDETTFGSAAGLATPGLQWRWAVEVWDTDFGGNPLETPATAGLAIDDLSLVYAQYHAEQQVGTCAEPAAVVAFDRFSYLQCPGDLLDVRVLDADAGGAVQVTVESEATGDAETFWISGSAPHFTATLPWSTGDGPQANDGTLYVGPTDRIQVTYHDGAASPVAVATIDCQGGAVIADGVAGLSDNGDGDAWADTNETVNLSIRLRNETGQPLQNVTARIDSDDPTIDCITKDTAEFGTIPAGGTGANALGTDPFTFKVSASATCADPASPPTATFRVLILADGFAGPLEPQEITLSLDLNDLPGTVTILEEFDAGTEGFVHELGPGDDDGATVNPDGAPCSPYADRFFWRSTGGNPGGGHFCWQNPADTFPNGNYGDLSDSALYSPVYKIGATATTLSFDHEYLFGWAGGHRTDGARVDYRVNGGAWRKLTTLPYDGTLIWNLYCNPLCNAPELGEPCFAENPGAGERIFNQLDQGAVNWTPVSGALPGLAPGDFVQFRWRVGSMRSSMYGISTAGGYGLDNVRVTNVVRQTCDAAPNPDVGCGVMFDSTGAPVEVCGDGDALVEPTERWSVAVTLRNSSPAPASNVRADLVPSAGSRNPATVSGNPGSFGTIPAAGGTAAASFEFIVGPDAACIEDVLFDLANVRDDVTVWGDRPSVFAIPIGGVGAPETAAQTVDPLTVADDTAWTALGPALTVPVPAFAATLDYDATYTNVTPVQTGTQLVNPLMAENGSVTTTLGAPFTISPDTVVSAVVNWTSLTHENVTACARVFLRTPSGVTWTLKAIGSPAANPYDVTSVYSNANGGAGQYTIGVEEVASGPCKQQATLTGATLTVTDESTTGSFTANAKVSLWDGSAEHVIKPFGAPDSAPWDITAIYDAAGPGAYELRLEENGAGGSATIADATITATGIDCDAGCGSFSPPAPPVGDGIHGADMTAGKGPAPDSVTIDFDAATCSADHAVVVYGTLGDYGDYQGAPAGCNLGATGAGTVTLPPGSVWFNVIWVNDAGAAGHPGFSSAGARGWTAAGLCGVTSDDPSDAVCN